jgi:hypothetical protein
MTQGQGKPLVMLLRASLATLFVLRAGGVFASYGLSGTFLNLQDRWLLLLGLGLGGLAAVKWGRFGRPLALSRATLWGVAIGVTLACYAGHYGLLMGYDLSRDEQMAGFDGWIYAAGRGAWPLAPAWRGEAGALNLQFMLPVGHPVAWVSAYLPMNALIRAVFGLLGDSALVGPLYTGGSVVLVWAVARRLWPDDAEAGAVAVMLLALSGQVVVMGMTAYAMPAHLFWNLAWLWLFLRKGVWANGAALAVGFVAMGLHQPLFHPMFVAPWLGMLLWERRWGRLAVFALCYGVMGGFWLWWPMHVHGLVAGAGSVDPAKADYVSRLVAVFAQNTQNLPIMACNLLRFCTWQMVGALPLLIAGLWAARRDPMGMALAVGLGLPVVVMLAILPYQGHGFGYRYVHGAMGNVALLGALGWRWLGAWRVAARPMLSRAALLSAIVLIPVQAAMAHGLYAPYARADARIAASGADYVLIGGQDGPYAVDLVLNRPDLGRAPLRLLVEEMGDEPAMARRLCAGHGRVALLADSFYDDISAYFHAPRLGHADGRLAGQSRLWSGAGCRIMVLR